MSLISEMVKAARLRDWDALDAAIESARTTRHRPDIDDGETAARIITSRRAATRLPDLSPELAAAVWTEFKNAPSSAGTRK